jgi:hypothetical protein
MAIVELKTGEIVYVEDEDLLEFLKDNKDKLTLPYLKTMGFLRKLRPYLNS